MNPFTDGGPAFPRTESRNSQGLAYISDSTARIESVGGMTLRDWFAGQALVGLCVGRKERVAQFADEAYRVSDAMLAARAKEPKP